jgi:hypothetical protein
LRQALRRGTPWASTMAPQRAAAHRAIKTELGNRAPIFH